MVNTSVMIKPNYYDNYKISDRICYTADRDPKFKVSWESH